MTHKHTLISALLRTDSVGFVCSNGPSAKVSDIKLSIALIDIQFFNKLERFTLADAVKFFKCMYIKYLC